MLKATYLWKIKARFKNMLLRIWSKFKCQMELIWRFLNRFCQNNNNNQKVKVFNRKVKIVILRVSQYLMDLAKQMK